MEQSGSAERALGAVGASCLRLRTLGELRDEGARMEHCVATRAGEALAGRSFLYSAEVREQPLTLELVRHARETLRLGDARGRQNRAVTSAEWRLLQPWLQALGVVRGRAE